MEPFRIYEPGDKSLNTIFKRAGLDVTTTSLKKFLEELIRKDYKTQQGGIVWIGRDVAGRLVGDWAMEAVGPVAGVVAGPVGTIVTDVLLGAAQGAVAGPAGAASGAAWGLGKGLLKLAGAVIVTYVADEIAHVVAGTGGIGGGTKPALMDELDELMPLLHKSLGDCNYKVLMALISERDICAGLPHGYTNLLNVVKSSLDLYFMMFPEIEHFYIRQPEQAKVAIEITHKHLMGMKNTPRSARSASAHRRRNRTVKARRN